MRAVRTGIVVHGGHGTGNRTPGWQRAEAGHNPLPCPKAVSGIVLQTATIYLFSMNTFLVRAIVHRTVLFGGGWLALAGPAPEALATGLVVTIVAVWLSLQFLPARDPLVLWRLARHLPRFVAESIRGGVDVAWRAFSPSMPLNPGWIELRSDLPEGARAALGGELSLMPGTLAAGSEDGKLIIHLLDIEAGFDDAIAREEAQIAAIIDQNRTGRA
jgi:multicomponent Na+:H+ antiporter subunit E